MKSLMFPKARALYTHCENTTVHDIQCLQSKQRCFTQCSLTLCGVMECTVQEGYGAFGTKTVVTSRHATWAGTARDILDPLCV